MMSIQVPHPPQQLVRFVNLGPVSSFVS